MENEKDEMQSMKEELESMRAELDKMKKQQGEESAAPEQPAGQAAPVAPTNQKKQKPKKKKKKGLKIFLIILAIIFVLILLVSCFGDEEGYEEESGSDSSSTSVIENSTNTSADEYVDASSFTLMVYVCGSDLESQGGAATSDLTEMMYAETGTNLNIIVQTGGASEWQNDIVSSDTVERYLLNSDGMTLLEDVGNRPVTDPDLMADFIQFATSNYPADRYGFIFWNHGGGTISGYGVDENFDSQGMSIAEIADGFEKANTKFDFIGFDCCLMSTIEIAKSLTPYADFLVASEETEPGFGWYYTNFLTRIENEPGLPMKEIGKQIIDDFMEAGEGYGDLGMTLSLIDLSQIDNVVDTLNGYLGNSENVLLDNGFAEFSQARSDCRAYGDNEFEQIDIIDYANRTSVDGKDELISAVQNCVLYSRADVSGSNGLAMYYPYVYDEYYGEIKNVTDAVGFNDTNYNNFFNDFVSIKQGGKASGKRSQNPFASKEEPKEEEPQTTTEDWYNADAVENYDYSALDSEELEITEKGDGYVLSLSDEEWDKITDVQIQVYVDDGEGYLGLGSDDLYEYDDDGDLMIDYDATWAYLDDSIIPYYAFDKGEKEDGTAYSLGYTEATLNDDEDIKIWILWEGNDEMTATVLGYTPYESGGVGSMANKGYSQFKEGDVIDFFFDYYTYDGEYEDSYYLEDNAITYSKDTKFEVAYGELLDNEYQICFYLKDIYQNEYWTEYLDISFEE